MSTVSWQTRPSNGVEIKHIVFVGFPVGFGIAALSLPLLYVAGEGGWFEIGVVLALGIYGVAFWQGASRTSAAHARASSDLPRVRVHADSVELPVGRGTRQLRLADTRMSAAWYDGRPSNRSIGVWLHLTSGPDRFTLIGHDTNTKAKEVGIPHGSGAPAATDIVRMWPADVADLFTELRSRGVPVDPPPSSG